MAYKVLNDFIENEHESILYQKGDTYPRKGFKLDAKRVAFLQKTHSEYKVAFLGDEEKEETKAPVKNSKSTAGSKTSKTDSEKAPADKEGGDDK